MKHALPIIKLELDHMKHEISCMLSDHNNEFGAMIQDALERELTLENLQDKIDYQVRIALDKAIKDLGTSFVLRQAFRESFEQLVIDQLGKEED